MIPCIVKEDHGVFLPINQLRIKLPAKAAYEHLEDVGVSIRLCDGKPHSAVSVQGTDQGQPRLDEFVASGRWQIYRLPAAFDKRSLGYP